MKKALIVIVFILLGVIAILLWKSKKPPVIVVNTPESELNEPLIVDKTPVEADTAILNGEEELVISEDTKSAIIDVKYPKFSNEDISRSVKDFAIDEIASFKIENKIEDLDNKAKEDPDMSSGIKYENRLTYKTYQTDALGSVIFSVYINTGGAHGNLFLKNLNYNQKGQLLSIGDLFKPESDYLTKLSDISRKKLPGILGENLASWSDDGTAPTSTNFETFYIKDDGTLNIVFQPYQVAPWAAGVPEISINISEELRDIIDPQFLE